MSFKVKEIVKKLPETECKECKEKIFLATFINAETDKLQMKKADPSKMQWLPFNALTKELHECKAKQKPGTPDSIKQQDLLDDTKTEPQPDKTGLLNLLCQEYKMGLDNQGLLDCFDIESKDILGAWAAFTEICKKNGLNNTIEINMLFKIFLDRWTSNKKKGKKGEINPA